jgi:NAD(P)-dependent dehydrogenase (short-subunit alcohol dehydrogenase family)
VFPPNVASEAALRGSAAGAAYTASKHAVVGLTKNSAVMYGPKGLRFNAVAPGPTLTNIVANWGSQLAAERLGPLMQATVPTPATAAQLAASITFLLSDDGTNINGAILASDGGWSALQGSGTQTPAGDGGKSRRRPPGMDPVRTPARERFSRQG